MTDRKEYLKTYGKAYAEEGFRKEVNRRYYLRHRERLKANARMKYHTQRCAKCNSTE